MSTALTATIANSAILFISLTGSVNTVPVAGSDIFCIVARILETGARIIGQGRIPEDAVTRLCRLGTITRQTEIRYFRQIIARAAVIKDRISRRVVGWS